MYMRLLVTCLQIVALLMFGHSTWCSGAPTTSVAGVSDALFPDLRSEDQRVRDACKMWHALSEPAVEDDAEKALKFADFDPSAHLADVLSAEVLPDNAAAKFQKKKAWFPRFEGKEATHQGGGEAAVLRYKRDGYELQIVVNRERLVVLIHGLTDKWDLSPNPSLAGLPGCLAEVCRAHLFSNATAKAILERGSVGISGVPGPSYIRDWMVSNADLPSGIFDRSFPCECCCVDSCVALDFPFAVRHTGEVRPVESLFALGGGDGAISENDLPNNAGDHLASAASAYQIITTSITSVSSTRPAGLGLRAVPREAEQAFRVLTEIIDGSIRGAPAGDTSALELGRRVVEDFPDLEGRYVHDLGVAVLDALLRPEPLNSRYVRNLRAKSFVLSTDAVPGGIAKVAATLTWAERDAWLASAIASSSDSARLVRLIAAVPPPYDESVFSERLSLVSREGAASMDENRPGAQLIPAAGDMVPLRTRLDRTLRLAIARGPSQGEVKGRIVRSIAELGTLMDIVCLERLLATSDKADQRAVLSAVCICFDWTALSPETPAARLRWMDDKDRIAEVEKRLNVLRDELIKEHCRWDDEEPDAGVASGVGQAARAFAEDQVSDSVLCGRSLGAVLNVWDRTTDPAVRLACGNVFLNASLSFRKFDAGLGYLVSSRLFDNRTDLWNLLSNAVASGRSFRNIYPIADAAHSNTALLSSSAFMGSTWSLLQYPDADHALSNRSGRDTLAFIDAILLAVASDPYREAIGQINGVGSR